MKRYLMVKIGVLYLLLGLSPAFGDMQTTKVSSTRNYTMGENIGLGGYDPVSYFPEGGSNPKKGLVLRAQEYQGVTYRFTSDANKEIFKNNPEKYVPAYGGWCAWAVAKLNKKVDIDPESYVIHNGKLYVFYHHKELNARKDWLQDIDELLPQGNANWEKLSQ